MSHMKHTVLYEYFLEIQNRLENRLGKGIRDKEKKEEGGEEKRKESLKPQNAVQ